MIAITTDIEVFKTNVNDAGQAQTLVAIIGESFPGYHANFDLDDCDRILRVKSYKGNVDADEIIKMLKGEGYAVEIL